MKQILLIATCFSLKLLAQPVPQLIKDIFPGDGHSYPGRFCEINDVVYFFANDGVNGGELWRTDATEEGTYMVKNIGPGAASHCESTWGCGSEYIVMNDILYFRATDNIHGSEIWRSDGTEAGTYMLKDINPGLGDCSNSTFMSAQYFTVMDDVLYFAADGGGNNIELWRSDGTEAGTYLVKDFAAGSSSVPQFLSNIDNTLYFQCRNADDESEIWKSDGTEAGSVLIKQMWTRSYDYGNAFFKFGDYVYFSGDDNVDAYNFELWRTDGTPSGTILFKSLNPEDEDGSDPREFHILNDKLIFTARPESYDVLFISDGTDVGTVQLKDNNGNDFSVEFYWLPAENKIYFNGDNDDDERGLWVTDGSDAGTTFLSAIESGSFADYSATVVNGNNIIYKGYDDDNGCTTIFQSNGTVDGTFQSMTCDDLSYPYEMITYNDKVILDATSDAYGGELWLFEPEFATGINDVAENNEIHIYPNPAVNLITIAHNHFGTNEKILVINTLGEIIYSSTLLSGTQTINIKNLTTGIYLIRINNSVTKFIKDK
ncbi:MAG: T9SS type A sorting domain-containing protein [Fimbriimonadaceae bacterium]|nr:T9SS type A sorting domain-containing protein [Chitinophagales bacterium]